MESGSLALEMVNITKSFPGVRALDDVTFACVKGEVHALCGENGAGKSTLMKILGGAYQPDSGRILLDGRAVAFSHPAAARKAGISVIHQELSLLPHRSVVENVFLGIEPTGYGMLDRARMRADSRGFCAGSAHRFRRTPRRGACRSRSSSWSRSPRRSPWTRAFS